MKDMLDKPSWKMRRRAVFFTLLFSSALIGYVAYRWESTSLAENLVIGAFGLMGATIATYIGGSAYEDVRTYKTDSEFNTYSGSYEYKNTEHYYSEEGMN